MVWTLAMAVGAFLYTVPSATGAAAVGAFSGYWLGIVLEKSRLRLPAGLVLLLFVYLLGWVFSTLPQDSAFLAGLLGAQGTYVFSQVGSWFFQSLTGVAALRFLSGRNPSLVSLEVITVALIMASPLAAHRNGFINRPYFLIDPLWSQNRDPIPYLLGLGALSAAILVLLAMGRRTRRASLIDLLLLLCIIGGICLTLPEHLLRDLIPQPKGGGMGLRGPAKPPAGKGKKPDKSNKDKDDDQMPLDKPPDQDQDQKQTPVAVVLLRDDYQPPLGYYYFRQTAFSQFNGQRLVADTTGLHDIDLIDHFPTEKTAIKSPVRRNAAAFQTLRTFVALVESHTKPFGMVDATQLAPANNPDPEKFVRAFDVESDVITLPVTTFMNCRSGNPEWKQEDWTYYTAMPSDPRYKQLSDKLLQGLDPRFRDSALAKAVAIKVYLDKTVTYTMKADHSMAEDPVAHYLFEEPRGYCVHQAHAAVYLMRAAGLAARVGAGYATDARNRAGGSTILLRSGEAHAWPEVFLDGVGWLILDISPEKAEEQEMKQPDPGLQRMLGEMARKQEKKNKEEKDKFEKKNLRTQLREAVLGLLGSLLWVLGGALVAVYLYKFHRRFEPLWCGSKRLGVAAMRSALDQLAEVGELRRYGESRLDFAKRVDYEALVPLTEYHYDAAYGRGETAPKRFLQLREQLHHQIARRHSWYRRLFGFLSPINWMRVH